MGKIKKGDFNTDIKLVTEGKFTPSARLMPHINEIMGNAYHVLNDQLKALRRRSEQGVEMDDKDVRKFSSLVESASKLARTERENAKAFDPSKLDDKELLEYLDKAKELLGG